jgi:hypothetical protein
MGALSLSRRGRGRQSATALLLDGETNAPRPAKNSAPVRLSSPVQLDLPFDLPPRGPRQCSSAKAGCQTRQNYKCVGRNIKQARSAGLFDWDSNRTSSPEGAVNVTKIADEAWLPIPGYERAYSISNMGRVRTEPRTYVSKNGVTKTVKARFLKCGATGGAILVLASASMTSRVCSMSTRSSCLRLSGRRLRGKKFSTMTVTR